MYDITLCVNEKCPDKNICYRYKIKELLSVRGLCSYAEFEYKEGTGCNEFIKLGGLK